MPVGLNRDLRVAIVHDWLVGGGAEKVVLAMHELFPDAPVYTSYATREWQQKLGGTVVTGYLQRWPFSALRKFLPLLRYRWFSQLDLSAYDLVISSSGNGEAMAVRTKPKTLHISYCHSPTHFYWRHYDQYMKRPGFGIFDPIARLGLRLLISPLRRRDHQAAQRPAHLIANSTHIQRDIQSYYGRGSTVIHPPVDTSRFSLQSKSSTRSGFVSVGRLVPYKRTDILIEACNRLQVPLTIIGRGPELPRLRKLAGPTVNFITDASDEEVVSHLHNAEAFLFAAFEDFGITPVEAMASGTPVIAYRAGGALDYIIEGKTGRFFDEQSADSLIQALSGFSATAFDPKKLQAHASTFSTERFKTELSHFIQSQLRKHRQNKQ